MRILGLSGSLRRESHNTRLLRGAGTLLPEDAELVVFDQLGAIPPFSEDDEHAPPPAVSALKQAIADADALLVATPEYNSSIPGVLKNALDWASRPVGDAPLKGKPAAVIGASTGLFGAVWAQAETRKVLGSTGARVIDRELPVGQADEALGADGLPLDTDVRESLQATLDELVEVAVPVSATSPAVAAESATASPRLAA
jgi:chromate reductase, NAD(P)H dehydrogenase (quinone)